MAVRQQNKGEKRGKQRHGNENRKRKRWKTAGRGVRGCGEKKQKRKSQRKLKARGVVEAKEEKAKELKEKDRSCPRQRDIVQIAESGDIDHRGAAAAEPPGTDTSDLTVPLQPLLPSPSVAASVSRLHRLPTRPAGNRITR